MGYRIFIVTLCFVICQAGQFMVKPGPWYPPTKGEVWPQPQYEKKKPTLFKWNKTQFQFKVLGESCAILTDALDRAQKQLNKQQDVVRKIRRKLKRAQHQQPRSNYNAAVFHIMEIDMRKPCETYPFFGMDESYNLTISAVSKLKSVSIWGMLRGLESFLQLIYPSDDYRDLLINGTVIHDYPRYGHRGLLLDTSRHYFSVDTIKTTLEAMAMNKMNVFHWHIVDDQSFPYQSEKFPELSEKGAYHPTMVYTKSDIKDIVNYARDRGIRVLPEIDVPGHTRSWGVAYPQLLTECYQDNVVVGLGPMNPIRNFTYKLLGEFIQEVQEWFPDQYYHLGGDEVDTDCWAKNPSLLRYMLNHNITSVKRLHALFMERVIPLLGDRSQPIVWQEVFDEHVPLPKNTLVQVWKDGWINEMNDVLMSGHSVLFSTDWYLSMLAPSGDWEKFYESDPRAMVIDRALAGNVVGGEACMWGEYVDDRNVLSRVWPRASAIAERLWSFASLDEPRHTEATLRDDLAGRASLDPVQADSCDPVCRADSLVSAQHEDSSVPLKKADSFVPVQNADSLVPLKKSDSFVPVQNADSFIPVQNADSLVSVQNADNLDLMQYTSSDLEGMLHPQHSDKASELLAAIDDRLRHASGPPPHASSTLLRVRRRLEEHACRMIRRGVPAQPPNGPGFCVA